MAQVRRGSAILAAVFSVLAVAGLVAVATAALAEDLLDPRRAAWRRCLGRPWVAWGLSGAGRGRVAVTCGGRRRGCAILGRGRVVPALWRVVGQQGRGCHVPRPETVDPFTQKLHEHIYRTPFAQEQGTSAGIAEIHPVPWRKGCRSILRRGIKCRFGSKMRPTKRKSLFASGEKALGPRQSPMFRCLKDFCP